MFFPGPGVRMSLSRYFPLVERELLRAGRSIQTYLARTYLTVIALLILAIAWWANSHYETGWLENDPEVIGRYFGYLAIGFQFLVVLLMAPGMAVPLIIREKEEDTLPLLILANKGRWDIIIAKYISVLLQVLMLVLCILPLHAFAALFGGIDVAGIMLQGLLISLIAATVCALGVFFSTVCKTTTIALLLLQSTLVVWFLLTMALDRVLPIAGRAFSTNIFMAIPGVAFSGRITDNYLPAILTTAAIGLWALLRAAYALPRQVLQAPVARPPRRFFGIAIRPAEHRPKRPIRVAPWPDDGLRRLIGAGAQGLRLTRRLSWVALFAFLGLFAIGTLPGVGSFIVIVVYLRTTARALGRVRASGALDDILLTPASNTTVMRAAFFAALQNSPFFLLPLVLGVAVTQWEAEIPAGIWMLIVAVAALQFAVCAAIACFTMTIARPAEAQERYAGLIYLTGVIFPLLLPYVCFIFYSAAYETSHRISHFLFDTPFIFYWTAAVSLAAATFVYILSIKRLRTTLTAGPPPHREHPLLALLRP